MHTGKASGKRRLVVENSDDESESQSDEDEDEDASDDECTTGDDDRSNDKKVDDQSESPKEVPTPAMLSLCPMLQPIILCL